ncbi:hypothetical protein SBA4_2520005 [Candidatus Sulfopaludibacter sp. SbA4]|nr:hypothetical protein SBA4_2520005 [Candidatus Sulfopaludibacter sp. SbA4]
MEKSCICRSSESSLYVQLAAGKKAVLVNTQIPLLQIEQTLQTGEEACTLFGGVRHQRYFAVVKDCRTKTAPRSRGNVNRIFDR